MRDMRRRRVLCAGGGAVGAVAAVLVAGVAVADHAPLPRPASVDAIHRPWSIEVQGWIGSGMGTGISRVRDSDSTASRVTWEPGVAGGFGVTGAYAFSRWLGVVLTLEHLLARTSFTGPMDERTLIVALTAGLAGRVGISSRLYWLAEAGWGLGWWSIEADCNHAPACPSLESEYVALRFRTGVEWFWSDSASVVAAAECLLPNVGPRDVSEEGSERLVPFVGMTLGVALHL
ncbi:MAG: hypothetical protein FJ087_02910 [Deltaproteobacteria bacterium]|nr:hypothetical protein [Deltaproteobacteria bacterium]